MKRTSLAMMSSCLLLAWGCLTGGCQTAGPKDFDEAMVLMGKMQKVAEAQGISWSADVSWNGSPEIYEQVAFGFDTGLDLVFRIQGNAQEGPKPDDEQP